MFLEGETKRDTQVLWDSQHRTLERNGAVQFAVCADGVSVLVLQKLRAHFQIHKKGTRSQRF